MSDKPVIVVPADDPPRISRSAYLSELRAIGDVRLFDDRPATDAEMLDRLADADVLLNSRSAVNVNESVIRQLPRLKMIAVCGIGYDAIDVEAADERGIVVSNIPGRTAQIVAEHAVGMMLAVSRRMARTTEELRAGHWSSQTGRSLIGKRIGIMGTGNIGQEMIRLCKAIGMEVVAWTFHPDEQKARELGFVYVSREELLESSDVVSLHVRLSDSTRRMIGAPELALMKSDAILVNTARAAIVDTMALVEAINGHHLFGAAVDVFDEEPMPKDNPLTACDNVVLTPHSADQTPEGLDILTLGCIENIQAFLQGKPQNVVNKPRLKD